MAADNLATSLDIMACFRLLLARDPGPEELSYHLQHHVGKPIDEIVLVFLRSDEFADRGLPFESRYRQRAKLAAV
ncbi:hypothetical protein [Methylobacterium trifolii]|uniref:Uncharacterized protein n=1 Tax=Methylobacterium trifolii TaxID=1003092 RepID=A0ABQ4TTW0_9HYPH|nr:hypothetical protein [Methylobacterium trifolii]GJE58756.1 hypothetical protein MPOCJGCO_0839 [Methylobacterium trifolii]